MVRIAVTIAALTIIPAFAAAQFPADVQPGTRVRVWLPEQYRQENGPARRQLLRATVESVASDTLRFSVPGSVGTLAVARTSIRRLDVSRGRPSRLASAAERAAAAAIAGAISSVIVNDIQRSAGRATYRTDWRAAGTGAAWGAAFGAAVGILWPNERWRRVRLAR